jgi:tetratricopeptide (TPR) repeat protein
MADHMLRRRRNLTSRWCSALVAVGAIAVAAAIVAPTPASSASRSGLHSLSGSYLAGRYAGRERDNASAAEFYGRALQADPNNQDLLERAFLLELSSANIIKAEYLARRMIGIDPRNRLARIIVGLREFKAGAFEEARSHWGRAVHGAIGQLTGTLLIAWSQAAEGDFVAAAEALESLAGNETFEPYRALHAAMIADLSGDLEAARPLYEHSYEISGAALRTVESYGNFLVRDGRPDEATAVYEAFQGQGQRHPSIDWAIEQMDQGTDLEPMFATARSGAAEVLYGISAALADETGLDFAIMYAQMAIDLRSDFPIARTLLAKVYETVRLYEDAIDSYSGIPEASPLWPNAEIQTAINLNYLERPVEARERLERIIEIDETAFQPPLTLANILRNRSEFEEAAEYYTRAVELVDEVETHHWTLFYFRGICFERQNLWSRAEADFLQALELQPEQPLVLNYLGYSWIIQRHNLVEAIEMIRKAVELRPDDGYIVDSLGWAHFQLKQFEDAVRELERAVELRPDDPIINDHLGDAYWRVGRELEARFQWQHALDLEPEPEDQETIERKLENGLVDEASTLLNTQSNRS